MVILIKAEVEFECCRCIEGVNKFVSGSVVEDDPGLALSLKNAKMALEIIKRTEAVLILAAASAVAACP